MKYTLTTKAFVITSFFILTNLTTLSQVIGKLRPNSQRFEDISNYNMNLEGDYGMAFLIRIPSNNLITNIQIDCSWKNMYRITELNKGRTMIVYKNDVLIQHIERFHIPSCGKEIIIDGPDRQGNNSSNPVLPSQFIYQVEPGEGLEEISKKFDVSREEIIRWNSLTSYSIYPGKLLLLYPRKRSITSVPTRDGSVVVLPEENTPRINLEKVVDMQTGMYYTRVTETGRVAEVLGPKHPKNDLWAYHKSAPIGSQILLHLPEGGFVALEVVARLKQTNLASIGLGKKLLESVYGTRHAQWATFSYPQPQ